MAYDNIVREGENAVNHHFLLFPKCFQPCKRKIAVPKTNLICCLETVLTHYQTTTFWTGQN